MNHYKHTQVGRVIVAALCIAAIVLGYIYAKHEQHEALIVAEFAIIVCAFLFGSLTTTVTQNEVKVRFGLGFVHKTFLLKNIESCDVVKNPWYYGWGIHYTPHGWLYNISGFDGVELRFKNGKKARIGTDDPQRLKHAIEEMLFELSRKHGEA